MENGAYKKYEPFFGGWYIRRLIGEGSYGKVFEIERKDTFGTVYTSALKVITVPPNSSGLEAALSDGMDRNSASLYFRDCVKELNREIALMSKLKGHSNIVSYEDHDVFQHEDGVGWDILIRMELLTPITRYLKDNRIFSHREVVQLGIDLCRALELCQRYDIIHRDIKPANIFLSDAQDFKLGDFGVARVAGAATAAYTRVGTLNYMAPEIFAGREYSGSVDIYSLGLVMYQLLNANRMPFYPPYPEPITYAAQERAHARRLGGEALPAPANTPDVLTRIVLKACAPDPAHRYKDPAVMRHELEAVQSTMADPNATMLMPDPVEHQPVPTEKTAVMPQESTVEQEKRLREERQHAAEEERLRMEREEARRQKMLEEQERQLAAQRERERRKAEEAQRQKAFQWEELRQETAPKKPEHSGLKLPLIAGAAAVVIAVGAAGGFALAKRSSSALPVAESRVVSSAESASSTAASSEAASSEEPESMAASEEEASASVAESEPASEAAESTEVSSSGSASSSSSEAPSSSKAVSSSSAAVSSSEAVAVSPTAIASGKCGKNAKWALEPDGTLRITGTGAMWDYNWNKNVNLWHGTNPGGPDDYENQIKTVIIEDGITSIGDHAFSNCRNMTSVSIPNSVTSISDYAFYDCQLLASLSLPDSITKIPNELCADCHKLTTVKLPSRVTSIGESAFSCTALQSINIPESVTSIGAWAFSATNLTSVVIPASITRIEYGTFYCSSSLSNVTIPASVKFIDKNAFLSTKLTSVTISRDCSIVTDSPYNNNNSFGSTVQISYYT